MGCSCSISSDISTHFLIIATELDDSDHHYLRRGTEPPDIIATFTTKDVIKKIRSTAKISSISLKPKATKNQFQDESPSPR